MHNISKGLAFCIAAFAMNTAAQTTTPVTNNSDGNSGTPYSGGGTIPVYKGSASLGNSFLTQTYPGYPGIGFFGINTTAPIAPLTVNGSVYLGWNYPDTINTNTANAAVVMGKSPLLELVGGGNANYTANIGLLQVNMGAGGMSQAASELYLGATNGATASARVAVGNGELLGMVGFFGDDGTTVRTRSAFIQSTVDTSQLPVTTSVVPADLYLGTTSSAAIIFGTQVNMANFSQVGSNPSVTAERMRIAYNGNVGIGTAAPQYTLDVTGTVHATGVVNATTSGVKYPDGNTQLTAWTGVLCGGDYAEAVNAKGSRKSYEPGDVLVIGDGAEGEVQKSSEPYSTMVAGIFATKPGVIGRRQSLLKESEEIPMAMIGIVPSKVTTENGPIHRGDLLVTSSKAGYGMKGTDRSRLVGAVIGKAMGSLESGTGIIEVLVTLQ
jgi:hypothetical protein